MSKTLIHLSHSIPTNTSSFSAMYADRLRVYERVPTFKYILVKLAMRCNMACTYCYWFRDPTVYDKPKVLTETVEQAFISKLEQHIIDHALKGFKILFHGGEPLLFGKERFANFCIKLRQMERNIGVTLDLSLTTNGLLVDEEWVQLFKRYRVSITVSIDGPPTIHDARRVGFTGAGTYMQAISALHLLRRNGISPGVLAVCLPTTSPADLCYHFVEELGITEFDVLVPDVTHDDKVDAIADYYIELFDLWYSKYSRQGVKIRFLENIVRGLLGIETKTEGIGFGPINTLTLLTDGSLEPLDVARIAGQGFTSTAINIVTHNIQDGASSPIWQKLHQASYTLPQDCVNCQFNSACGGGYLPSRWSEVNSFDNPSAYCADFKRIFAHVWERISADLVVHRASRTT